MPLQVIEWSAYKALKAENDELLARVRELEAQAVRDAKVIEAARAYRIAQRAVQD